MPTLNTKFTFPEDLIFTDKMAFDFIKLIDFDLNKAIVKHYNVENINKDIMMEIKKDLIKERYYGGDDGGWTENLYWIVARILDNGIFNFVKIDEAWDDEGSDRHYYYEYVNTEKVVKDAEKEIKKQIKILEKYGKRVELKIT